MEALRSGAESHTWDAYTHQVAIASSRIMLEVEKMVSYLMSKKVRSVDITSSMPDAYVHCI